MHLLSIHGVHCIRCDHHPEITIASLESRAEDAGGRVDPGKDQRVDPETTEQKREVRCIKGAIALLASHHEIAICIELRDDFCSLTFR